MNLLEHVKQLIGVQETLQTGTIDLSMIRRYARATADFNPIYWDEKYAKKSRFGSIIAPPTMIFEMNLNIQSDVNEEDGSYPEIKILPEEAEVLRAGNEYEILAPVKVGDKITVSRKIIESYEKQGKKGTLIFVVSEMKYSNQDGALVGVNKETLIFIPRDQSKGEKP